MNDMQRKALIAVGTLVLGMLVYPPYRLFATGDYSSSIIETGYAWLFALPDQATVDVATLAVQWIGVLIVGAIAFFVLKDK